MTSEIFLENILAGVFLIATVILSYGAWLIVEDKTREAKERREKKANGKK